MKQDYYEKYETTISDIINEAVLGLQKDVARAANDWYKTTLPKLDVEISFAIATMLKSHPDTQSLTDEEIEAKRLETLPHIHQLLKNNMTLLMSDFYADTSAIEEKLGDVNFVPSYLMDS